MGRFTDKILEQEPRGRFLEKVIAPPISQVIPEAPLEIENIRQQQAEIMERMGEDIIGPVAAPPEDVSELAEAGIISPEDLEGKTLGEIAKDPENQRLALELGLMTLGSVIAPQIALPAAATRFPRAAQFLSRVAGAGTGGFLGSLAAEARDPTEKPLETATRAGAAGLVGETVGGLAVKAGGKFLAPFKERLVAGAKAAANMVAKRGGLITPGRLSESRLIDTAESVAGASIFGGGRIKEVSDEAIDISRGIADDFVESFSTGATREDTSLLVQDAIQEGVDTFKELGRSLYGKVDELTGAARVDITATKKLADQLLAKSEKGLGSPDVSKIVNKIKSKGDIVSFEEAQALRSDLLGVVRAKEKGLVAGKGEATAKRLVPTVDRAMQDGARGISDEALTAWRTANAHWKSGSKTFNDRIIKNLATRSPDGLFNTAFKTNNPATIRKIKSIVGDKKAWQEIQGQWTRDVFEKSSNELGELSGTKLLRQIKRWGDGGSLKEIMSPEQIINMRQVARTLQIAEAQASREKVGSIAIQLLQVGAAGTIFSLNENKAQGAGTAAAIIFGPAIIAKALTNKSFARWLTVGVKAPPGSAQGVKAAARLTAILEKEGAVRREE